MKNITVIGSGKFGCAVAFAASCSSDNIVTMYSRSREVVDSINSNGFHPSFPGINLGIVCSGDFVSSVSSADYLFLTVPSFATEEVLRAISSSCGSSIDGKCLILCAKGLMKEAPYFYSELVKEILSGVSVAIFSGPSFASEIMCGIATVVNVASDSIVHLSGIKSIFSGSNITVDPMQDMFGLQLLGAYKNAIAVMIGIEEGMMSGIKYLLNDNSVEYGNKISSIFVDMLNELSNLLVVIGSDPKILLLYGGLGDIILTCCMGESRNRRFGKIFGEEIINDILSSKRMSIPDVQNVLCKKDALKHLVCDFSSVMNRSLLRNDGVLSEGFHAVDSILAISANFDLVLDRISLLFHIFGSSCD